MRLQEKTLKMHLSNNREFLNAFVKEDIKDASIK